LTDLVYSTRTHRQTRYYQRQQRALQSTVGDFTFWISLSLSLKTERKA